MDTPVIELKNVGMKYRTKRKLFKSEYHTVFEALSMSINKGEKLGIIGRNGVGKSTLLRLLAGIYKPDKGDVIRRSQKISLLSLSAGFDIALSGYDNAILSSIILGAKYEETVKKINEIIEFSELEDFIYKPVRTYSSGMKARLGFSVALKMNTDVLLIDEVLGVGDRKFRQKAEFALLERIRSDMTVVFVSHSEGQIKKICDRVLWIERGEIVEDGEPQYVLQKYNEASGSS